MTPAQMGLLVQAHNKYNDPESGKATPAKEGGLAAFANLKQG